ncbi:MAG: phosphoglycerate kinase [Deltaproteobacteria bacterium]|nr:phosphoglycerate kinase [Deltaproteobacteria bacterium]
MAIRSIDDLNLAGKRVFVRVDFNVPQKAGVIQDDSRIRAALPTLKRVLEAGGSLILASHLGRPKAPDPAFSLAPVAARLADLLGIPVALAPEVVGPEAQRLCAGLAPGQALLLENVRFHPGETKNDPELSRQLAALADLYVNDAFGACHRAHATTAGMAACFAPDRRAAGYLLQKELGALRRVLDAPEKPFVAVIGGAKVSDKIAVVDNLLGRVDRLLVGGGMAYTFLAARGVAVGDSLLEADRIEGAALTLEKARSAGCELLLPTDHVVARDLTEGAETRTTAGEAIEAGWKGLDIGPKTREAFAAALAGARTVVWNGPMGVFENPAFAEGTFSVARAVAGCPGFTVVGGGDSVSAVKKSGVADRIGHISTGGGASLEFLEGKTLPGVAALEG